jgi:cell division protein FtsW (lipid II flippase)
LVVRVGLLKNIVNPDIKFVNSVSLYFALINFLTFFPSKFARFSNAFKCFFGCFFLVTALIISTTRNQASRWKKIVRIVRMAVGFVSKRING